MHLFRSTSLGAIQISVVRTPAVKFISIRISRAQFKQGQETQISLEAQAYINSQVSDKLP